MSAGENRRRKHSKRDTEGRSLWGYLFRKDAPAGDMETPPLFREISPEEEDGLDIEEPDEHISLLRELWNRFNFWSLLATLIYLAFIGVLLLASVRMWTPQDLKDIAGYADKGNARDLSVMLRNANGSEISFTEAELNRYLRETCRMRQTGFFSIFAHAQGVAVRIHNGYAEVVIDRIVGVNMHQTTAVNLTFSQEVVNGRPELKVDLRGGAPIFGTMPRGGSIGRLGVPQRHIQVLKPALETLMDCYPEIAETISTHGYRPVLTEGGAGEESRVTLIPFTPNT